MAPLDTLATILSTSPYRETSKLARLATRELGVISVLAKGARRPKSPFGAALQLFSQGTAVIYLARASDLHTLASFDLTTSTSDLGRSVPRYAVGSVLAELMGKFAPHERQPELYDFFRRSLDLLAALPEAAVPVVGLRAVWGLVRELGFAPIFDRCVRDGALVDPTGETVAFSAALGGVVCSTCARTMDVARLPARELANLEIFLNGTDQLPDLDDRHFAAHARLADRFIRYHIAEGAALPALTFWSEFGRKSGS